MHSTPTRANIPLPSLPPLNLERSIRRGFGINIESRGGKEEGGIDVNTPSTVVTGGKQDALSLTRLPISFTPFEERNRRPLLVYVSLSLFLLSSTVVRVTRLLEIVRYFDLAEFLDYSTLAIRGFSEGSERSVPFRVERRVLRSLLAREARGEATRTRPLPFPSKYRVSARLTSNARTRDTRHQREEQVHPIVPRIVDSGSRTDEWSSSRSYPSSPSPSTFALYMYISRACFDDRVFVTPRLVARVVSRFESRGIKPLPICRRKAYE